MKIFRYAYLSRRESCELFTKLGVFCGSMTGNGTWYSDEFVLLAEIGIGFIEHRLLVRFNSITLMK